MKSIRYLVILTFVSTICFAADWNQWRGPGRDGISGSPGLLKKIPEKLNASWKMDVGEGQSSPIVHGSDVYMFAREGEQEVLRALNISTGKELWKSGYEVAYEAYPGAASFGKGPKSTPVYASDKIYTLGVSGILSAFFAKDGKLAWQKNFRERFPESYPPFGTSMSPIVDNGLVIAHVGGHNGGALIAFDAATGEEKWSWNEQGPSYSSPIAWKKNGVTQIVLQVHRKVIGIDSKNGKLAWDFPFVTPCDQNVPTPLIVNDRVILSSMDHGIFALKFDAEGKPDVAWQTKEASLYMSSPVLLSNHIFGFSYKKKGQYFSLDPQTGSLLWSSTGAEAQNAAIIVQDDKVVSLENDGQLLLFALNGKGFEAVKRYDLDITETWAHPVPTSHGFLVKDRTTLSHLTIN